MKKAEEGVHRRVCEEEWEGKITIIISKNGNWKV